MTKDKRNIRRLTLGIVFFSLLVLALSAQYYYRTHGFRTARNNEETIRAYIVSDGLKEFTRYLLVKEPEELDFNTMTKFIDDNRDELDELESYNMAAYYFINAAVQEYMGETRNAQICYEKCLEYRDPASKNDLLIDQIYGRCCYRLGVIAMNLKHFDTMKEYFGLMDEILSYKESREYLVDYYINIVSDYYLIEDGSAYASGLAENMIQTANLIGYKDRSYMYYVAAMAYSADGNTAMYINYIMSAINEYTAKQSEDPKDRYYAIMCYTSIGSEYAKEKKYVQGRWYLLSAYEIDIDDDEELKAETKAYVLQNLTSLELQAGDIEAAERYLIECKMWIDKEDREMGESDRITYQALRAEYLCTSGKCKEALDCLDVSYGYYLRCDHFAYTNFDITLHEDYGTVYLALKDYDKAAEHFLAAKSLIEYRGINDKYAVLKGLFDCYRYMQDYPNMAYYAGLYQDYLNTQLVETQSTQSAFFEYMNNQQSDTIVELTVANKYMYMAVIAIAIGLVIAILLLVVIRRKKVEFEALSKEFRRLSEADALTGLYNRRSLTTYLQDNWQKLLKGGKTPGIVMIDVDYFKKYNDRYGHQMGDEVLKAVAEAFNTSVRKNRDFVARYGGEEFIIVLPEITQDLLVNVLERIRSNIADRAIEHKDSLVCDVVTVSMGAHIATGTEEENNYESVIKMADNALYKAKEKRNCFVIE